MWTRKGEKKNQMPLDWPQKAPSGGAHSACWLPAETRASLKTMPFSASRVLAWSWGPRDTGLGGRGPAPASSLPRPHGIKMPGAEWLSGDLPPVPPPAPSQSVASGCPEAGNEIKATGSCLASFLGEKTHSNWNDGERQTSPKMNLISI